MTEVTKPDTGWLSREEMDAARERLPILYVDAVPVRVDDHGVVTKVGMLLRIGEDGQGKRALVAGRVVRRRPAPRRTRPPARRPRRRHGPRPGSAADRCSARGRGSCRATSASP